MVELPTHAVIACIISGVSSTPVSTHTKSLLISTLALVITMTPFLDALSALSPTIIATDENGRPIKAAKEDRSGARAPL